MSIQPIPKTISLFVTREENIIASSPLETVTYLVYDVETEYEGQFQEYGFIEYIAGVIGAEIGYLDPPWHAMVALGIAAVNYALWKLGARGYITDMSGMHQAFTTKHITAARMEAAAEAVKWRIMSPDGESAEGIEYCDNSGGYTVAGRYPWIIAQYDKWTDYNNGCPLDIKNHPEYAEGFCDGHRRGMSQDGAIWAANQFNFVDILEFYYPGTKVVRAMPFIYQSDPRIADLGYLSDEDTEAKQTNAGAGCGPDSLKMCEYALKGGYDDDKLRADIQELLQFSIKNGCKADGGTRIEKLCSLWCPGRGMSYVEVGTLEEARAIIAAWDGVAIINVDKTNGLFSTTGGHYVAAIYIDGWGWWVHNPGKIGHDNENRFYTDDEVQSAFKGLAVVIWEGAEMANVIKLSQGDSGMEVAALENKLAKLGYSLVGKDGKSYQDDYWGTVTTAIIKEIQTDMVNEGVEGAKVSGGLDQQTEDYIDARIAALEKPAPGEPAEAVDYDWLKDKIAVAWSILDEIAAAFDL